MVPGTAADLNWGARNKELDLGIDALPTAEGEMVAVLLFRPTSPIHDRIEQLRSAAEARRLLDEALPALLPYVRDDDLADAEAEVVREAGHAVDDEALVAAPHGDAHLRGRSLGRARAWRRGPRGDARRRGRSSSAPSCSASGAGTRRAR